LCCHPALYVAVSHIALVRDAECRGAEELLAPKAEQQLVSGSTLAVNAMAEAPAKDTADLK